MDVPLRHVSLGCWISFKLGYKPNIRQKKPSSNITKLNILQFASHNQKKIAPNHKKISNCSLIFSVIIVLDSANYQETVFNYGMVITALCSLEQKQRSNPELFPRYSKAPKSQQINGQFSCVSFVLIKLLGESTMNLNL